MTPDIMFRVFGEVDEGLIADAAPKAHRTQAVRWVAAACLLLVVGSSIALWQQADRSSADLPLSNTPPTIAPTLPTPTDTSSDIPPASQASTATFASATQPRTTTSTTQPRTSTTPTTHTTVSTRHPTTIVHTTSTQADAYLIPHWDEKTLTEQFSTVIFMNDRYTVHGNSACVPANKVGRSLGTATLEGYDIYTDTTHTITADLYAIDGIAEHCAVAVRFVEQEGYYPYLRSWYRPETLGDLLDDLNLKENLVVGDVWHDYFTEDMQYRRVKFSGLDSAAVWELLLYDPTLPNVNDDRDMHVSVMSISVDVPLLGHENISLAVTEDGYLTTNILDTGKVFFLGIDRVQTFMDYVSTHCEREEYVFPTESSTPTTGTDTEATVTMTSRPPAPFATSP